LRTQVEADGKEGIRSLGLQLVKESQLKRYIAVRKGKTLLIRALRWLNTSQMRVVCSTLWQNYPLAVKKDRDDKLLKEFWSSGIRRHISNCSSMGLLHNYLTLLTTEQPSLSKSGSTLKHMVTTGLGVSFLLGLIHRLSVLHQQQPNADVGASKKLLLKMGQKMADECKTEKIASPVTPLAVELKCWLNNKDLETESYSQLARLVSAGMNDINTSLGEL
jgi:hypothetical protein